MKKRAFSLQTRYNTNISDETNIGQSQRSRGKRVTAELSSLEPNQLNREGRFCFVEFGAKIK